MRISNEPVFHFPSNIGGALQANTKMVHNALDKVKPDRKKCQFTIQKKGFGFRNTLAASTDLFIVESISAEGEDLSFPRYFSSLCR